MRQFPSNMMTCLAIRSKDRIRRNPGMFLKALAITITVSAPFWIVSDYFAEELPTVAVLCSLFSGFAPLIGLFVLLTILSLLLTLLICKAETWLADEDDSIVTEPHLKPKWRLVTHCIPDLFAHRLSLQEHSPPAPRFS